MQLKEYAPTMCSLAHYAVPVVMALSYTGCDKDNPVTIERTQPPDAPTALVAQATGEKTAALSWNDNSNDETGFYVKRAPSISGTYSKIDSVGANVTKYTDNSLQAGNDAFYKVTAFRKPEGLESLASNIASARTPINPPSKPILTAMPKSWGRIDLGWTDSDNETQYRLFRGTSKSSMQFIGVEQQNSISYVDSLLEPLTDYFYAVIADRGGTGLSTSSDTLSAKTQAALIKVYGQLKDALTGGTFSGVPVDVTYKNTGQKTTAITDANGNYRADVTLGKGVNHDIEVGITSGQLYNYLRKLSTTSRNQIGDKKEDIVDFERFTETGPIVDASADSLRDAIKFISYMGFGNGIRNDISYVAHWRFQDVPLNVYFGGMPESYKTWIRNAIIDAETKIGKKIFNEVTSDPEIGVNIVPSISGGENIDFQYIYDNNNNPIYPKKVNARIATNFIEYESFKKTLFHALFGHGTNATTQHSPFTDHNIRGSPFATAGINNELTDFEKQILTVLYNLPNTVDKQYLLYR